MDPEKPIASLGFRKVWLPRDEDLDLFKRQIESQVHVAISNACLPEACPRIFVHLYSIGWSKKNSKLVIMICCVDKDIRRQTETAVRASRVLERAQDGSKFHLGSGPFPPQSKSPVVRFGDPTATEHDVTSREGCWSIYAQPGPPVLGQALFSSNPAVTNYVGQATGGAIFEISGKLYQLTAGHILSGNSEAAEALQSMPDDLEFIWDGMDDDMDNVSEASSEAVDITSRASFSPILNQSFTEDLPVLGSSPGQSASVEACGQTSSSSSIPGNQTTLLQRKALPMPPDAVLVGEVEYESFADASSLSLDYALVRLENAFLEEPPDQTSRTADYGLRPIRVGMMPHSSTKVLVVTSGGALEGILVRTAMAHLEPGTSQFQSTWMVLLKRPLQPGDCGSAVVCADVKTIYGHVVLAAPEANVAYLVPALELCQHLSTKLGAYIQVWSSQMTPDR